MPRSHPTSTSLLATLRCAVALTAGALLAPAIAEAQAPPAMPSVPGADAFVIRYYVTDEEGNRGRAMDSVDFTGFYNQARCECGQEIYTEVRLKVAQGMTYDMTKPIQTYVGTNCASAATNPVGMFRPCALAIATNTPTYTNGISFNFHPVWMVNGVSGMNNDLATATAAGSCSTGQGQAGVWMCADTNGMTGCQSDEFFITGAQNANLPMGMTGGIQYDFAAPMSVPAKVTAIPGDEAIVVSWEVDPGDINGFRVLCEEVDTERPPPDREKVSVSLTGKQNGTLYFTKENLCGGKPFSTYKGVPEPAATTTAATGSTGDTESIPPNCGDGVVNTDEGEECDNSADNGPNNACHENCKLDVCGDGLSGPDEQCDNGADNGDAGLCKADCTANASDGLINLDWDYVCTPHLGLNSRSVRISGLDNGKQYNFLVVAYDKAGNPVASKELIRAAPVPTNDLWDQCKAQGDVCGESGFCNVAGRGDRLLGLAGLIGVGLGLGGLVRRSRRKRA